MVGHTSRLQRRRNFFRRLRIYAYTGGAFLLLVGLVYLAISSPLFKIGSLEIVGAPIEQHNAILASLRAQVIEQPLGWLGTENYLAWPTTLEYAAPLVASISVEKAFWPRSIVITATPRQRFAVWCTGSSEECYWVDADGILFEPAPVAEGQLVYTIFDTSTTSAGVIGKPVLPATEFAVIHELVSAVQNLSIGITKITVNRSLQEVWFDTASGARILASLRFDPKPTSIPAIARFAEKPGYAGIEYLNLTVENRAFVKYRQ